MDRYPALPHAIRFGFHGAAAAARTYPYVVEFRRLPCPLVEIATGTWSVEFDRRERARVRPGEVLVVPGDVRHRMEMVDGPPMTSEWALCAFLWQGTLDAVAMCDVPHVLPASAGGRVRGLLRRLREFAGSAATGDACATAALHATGFDLLGVLLEHAERPTLAPIDEELARVLPAVRYAQEHLTERLTRRALADEAHLSESRFHDVFSRALRMAPLTYVMHLRMKRARELLLATDLPVYAVAERCGFNSPHYFSRIFAARAGVPPGRYRESLRLG